MRLRLLLPILLLSSSAFATPFIAGPAQFGSSSPFNFADFNQTSATTGVVALGLPDSGAENALGSYNFHISDIFTFALDPGWSISSIELSDFRDYVTDPMDLLPTAANFRTAVSFCPAGQTCTSKQFATGFNTSMLQPLAGLDQATQGFALYQFDAATLNLGLSGAGRGFLNIYVTDSIAPTPEPSTLALLGTGIFGLVGAVRRRLS